MAEGFETPELEKENQKFGEMLAKFGMAEIKQGIEKSLEEWKEVPFKIAVTGRSGVGKSSFINALRGLKRGAKGAAEVGTTETTTEVQQFPHPKNNQLILCDLPGVGTTNFPKETYFTDKCIEFDTYDLFIILISDRFTENDLCLAQGIKKINKGFLFIRSKMNQDFRNEIETRQDVSSSNHDDIKKHVIETASKECMGHLQEFCSDNKGRKRVFLIDSYAIDEPLYDFNSFTDYLIENFESIKRDSMIMSLTPMTPAIIDAKEKALRERIWKLCVLSAIGGAVPIPGASLALDAALVLKEAMFYREQFGLNSDRLQGVAQSDCMQRDGTKRKVDLKSIAIDFTKKGIMAFCSALAISEVAEKSVQIAIPAIGSLIGGVLSYCSTRQSLNSILEIMANDARKLNKYLTEMSQSTTM